MDKRKYDDVSDVTGVRSSDDMLFIGEKPMMFMKKYVKGMTVVRDVSELDSEFVRHFVFDRVFVDVPDECFDDRVLERVFDMNCGTVTFFIDDDDRRDQLERSISEKWCLADVWNLMSNVGGCLVTNARGRNTLEEDFVGVR